MKTSIPLSSETISRRRFVQGLAAGGALAGLGGLSTHLFANPQPPLALAGAPELRGTVFNLTIGEVPVNFTGANRIANAVNGSIPAPTLRWREGDSITLHVKNTLPETSSIHWHGILLPANMDGVPGLSFKGIPPGKTFTYQFTVKQTGTYWYHSHSGVQEQKGVYGAIIIEPRNAHRQTEVDQPIILSDWTDEDPMRVFAKLKKMGEYYNFNQRTVGDLINDIQTQGVGPTLVDRALWGEMRMTPTDLADVSAYTYTYLMNGQNPANNYTLTFQPGQKCRLRFINAAAMTFFDVRIPGLKMTVLEADGQPVQPVTVDEFRIGVAETYVVLVEPASDSAYTIFAQSMDRSGFARGTLTPRMGMSAPVPTTDPRPQLTMADMGHGGHGEHGGSHTDHSQHNMAATTTTCAPEHAAMGHCEMSGEHSSMARMQNHPASEMNNPGIDMLTMMPVAKLDDPGIGLRNNGRKVLTYADLHSTFNDPDGREPSREIELHLTGHMERYMWSFNGIKFADAEPLRLTYGERVRFTLVNDTMMSHPIHLHGVWSDLEHENGEFGVRKHTIIMPPGSKRSYRVSADALGRWAYHCHLLFHMEAGMFREVRIDV